MNYISCFLYGNHFNQIMGLAVYFRGRIKEIQRQIFMELWDNPKNKDLIIFSLLSIRLPVFLSPVFYEKFSRLSSNLLKKFNFGGTQSDLYIQRLSLNIQYFSFNVYVWLNVLMVILIGNINHNFAEINIWSNNWRWIIFEIFYFFIKEH